MLLQEEERLGLTKPVVKHPNKSAVHRGYAYYASARKFTNKNGKESFVVFDIDSSYYNSCVNEKMLKSDGGLPRLTKNLKMTKTIHILSLMKLMSSPSSKLNCKMMQQYFE